MLSENPRPGACLELGLLDNKERRERPLSARSDRL